MTAKAQRLLVLLHDVEEWSFQDGRMMNNPRATHTDTDATLTATRIARFALLTHLRTMTTEDLETL